MPDKLTEDAIEEAMRARQEAYESALIEQAKLLAEVESKSVLKYLEQFGRDKYTLSVSEGVTEKMVQDYQSGYTRGGSTCIERVVKETDTPGMYKTYTRRRFIPWLDDMSERDRKEILDIIAKAEKEGLHPNQIQEKLEEHFQNTRHRSRVAARTEATKVRNDSIVNTYRNAGVQYVEYITAGDERVRPEHAARDGKIYPIGKAPYLGEYMCRCRLADADYQVEEKGREVTTSQTEYLTAEQLGVSQ